MSRPIRPGGFEAEGRRSPFCVAGIHAIQHQHVEMRIEIQRAAEALDKGHRAALDLGVALRLSKAMPIPSINSASPNSSTSRPLGSSQRRLPLIRTAVVSQVSWPAILRTVWSSGTKPQVVSLTAVGLDPAGQNFDDRRVGLLLSGQP